MAAFREDYVKKFMDALRDLQSQGSFTDVILRADGADVSCHKVVLAASSPYFNAMFTSGLEESNRGIIELINIRSNVLQLIVDFMYCHDCTITCDNVEELVKASDMLALDQLKHMCEEFMISALDITNCLGFCSFAKFYQLSYLRLRSESFMMSGLKDLVGEPEFKEMPSKDLIEYISNDNLSVTSEDPIFDAVVKWTNYDVSNRREEFESVVEHIRLQWCTNSFLCDVVTAEPLMRNVSCQTLLNRALACHIPGNKQFNSGDKQTPPRTSFNVRQILVVGGGIAQAESENRTCWFQDGRKPDDGWQELQHLPARFKLFSAIHTQENILVTGGWYSGIASSKCWMLNVTNSNYHWKSVTPLVYPRCRHGSVFLGGNAYVIGGIVHESVPFLSCVERLKLFNAEPAAHWISATDMPKPLGHPITVANKSNIFVFGGIEQDGTDSKSTLVYNTVWDNWEEKSTMPESCKVGAGVSFMDKIYLVGGYGRTCMMFEPDTECWTLLARPHFQHGHAPATVWQGKILVCGGSSREPTGPNVQSGIRKHTNIVEKFDPDTNTWRPWITNLPAGLSWHFAFGVDLGLQA